MLPPKEQEETEVVFLTPKGKRIVLECREDLPSVNGTVQAMATAGLAEGHAVLSDYRTPGTCPDAPFLSRKKNGRGIRLAWLLRPAVHVKSATLLSAMAAVALCRAIESMGQYTCSISWVDDVYINRTKIAVMHSACSLREDGYLRDMVLDLSLYLSPALFPEKLSDTVTEVFAGKAQSLPGEISKTFLREFFVMYENLALDRSFIEEYRERSCLDGRRVIILQNGKKRRTTVLGINDNAHLLVEAGHRETFVLTSRSELLFP